MDDKQAGVLQGRREQRDADAERLRFEARSRSPLVREILLSIARDIENETPVPEGVD